MATTGTTKALEQLIYQKNNLMVFPKPKPPTTDNPDWFLEDSTEFDGYYDPCDKYDTYEEYDDRPPYYHNADRDSEILSNIIHYGY